MKILSFILCIMTAISLFFIGAIRKPTSTLVLDGDGHSIAGADAIHHKSHNGKDLSKNQISDTLQLQKENPIDSKVTVLRTELEISSAIDRLNRGSATDDERLQIFEQFKELDRLRTIGLETELAEIEKEVAQLESQLPEKLRGLGVNP